MNVRIVDALSTSTSAFSTPVIVNSFISDSISHSASNSAASLAYFTSTCKSIFDPQLRTLFNEKLWEVKKPNLERVPLDCDIDDSRGGGLGV